MRARHGRVIRGESLGGWCADLTDASVRRRNRHGCGVRQTLVVGLFGTTPTSAHDKGLSHPASMPIAAAHRSVSQVGAPAPKTLPAYHPAMPSSHTSMHLNVSVPVQAAPAMTVPVSPMR